MIKQNEEKKDLWVKLLFSDTEVAKKLYDALPSKIFSGVRLIETKCFGRDIEFDRKSLLEKAEKLFDKIIPNWRDNIVWICGG